MPSLNETTEAFASAGFEVESMQSVRQQSAKSLRAYYERVKARADSSLIMLSDDEFARGLQSLELAASKEAAPTPVIDTLDLVVLR